MFFDLDLDIVKVALPNWLKSGLVFKARNKQLYLVVGEFDIVNLKNGQPINRKIINGYSHKDINNVKKYNNIINKEFDIIEVYEDYTLNNLLWHRKEISMSTVEKEICITIPKGLDWIARDESGELWAFTEKPVKDLESGTWSTKNTKAFCCSLNMFSNKFQFVKWEDENPINFREYM